MDAGGDTAITSDSDSSPTARSRTVTNPQLGGVAGSSQTALSNDHALPADHCSRNRQRNPADQGASNGYQRR